MAWSTVFPETSVQLTRFDSLGFGDENARRANAYRSIMAETAKLMKEMPADRKAAFYVPVEYPVEITGNLNLQQLDLGKSVTYDYQNRASANLYAEMAHQAPYIPTWRGTNRKRCGIQVEGGGYFNGRGWWFPILPRFHRELGARNCYFDIFTQQPEDSSWSATPNEPWIRIDHTSGKFSPVTKVLEQRIHVSVDWSMAPKEGDGTISVKCSDAIVPMQVHVRHPGGP